MKIILENEWSMDRYSGNDRFYVRNHKEIECFYYNHMLKCLMIKNSKTGEFYEVKQVNILMKIFYCIFVISMILLSLSYFVNESYKLYHNGIKIDEFLIMFTESGKPIPFKLGNDVFVVGTHEWENGYKFSITKNGKQIALIKKSVIIRNFWDRRKIYTVHYDKNEDLLFIVTMVCRISIRFWDPSNGRGNGVSKQYIEEDPYPERAFWLPDDEKDE